MKTIVHALALMAVVHLGAGAGSARAQSAGGKDPVAKEATDVKKPDDAKEPAASKKAEDAKKPEKAQKAADAKKPAEAYKSNEIYQSSASLLGKKLAVGGYDAVAYHTQGKPVAGTDEFTHTWKGATWRFASKESLDTFVKEPEKYAPQYGGYCAFAVGHGSLASGDPTIWKIVDGKLYLNLSKSVQTSWERDIPGLIKRGDANWPKLLK